MLPKRAKLFDLLDIHQRISGQVQPAVEEHRAVARAQDKSVTVQPARVLGIVLQRLPEKNGPNFRATQRQTEMPRRAGVNGIHGEAASFGGGAGKGGQIEIHKGMRKRAARVSSPDF